MLRTLGASGFSRLIAGGGSSEGKGRDRKRNRSQRADEKSPVELTASPAGHLYFCSLAILRGSRK
jgi:hypothetical protein